MTSELFNLSILKRRLQTRKIKHLQFIVVIFTSSSSLHFDLNFQWLYKQDNVWFHFITISLSTVSVFEKLIAAIVAENVKEWIQLSNALLYADDLIESVIWANTSSSSFKFIQSWFKISNFRLQSVDWKKKKLKLSQDEHEIFFLRIFVFIIFLNNVHNYLNLHGFFFFFILKLDYNFPTSHHHATSGGTLWSSLF